MKISIHTDITEIPGQQWNKLVKDNHPFIRHEFLAALESCGCVGEKFGWLPKHIAIYEQGQLVAAMPLYEKHNSYGEFVFDNAWADAYARHDLRYFPKLVSAIPYTPVTGQRLLVKMGLESELLPVLFDTAMELARSMGASGLHWLFPQPPEQAFLQKQADILVRHDCQFHWRNRDYQSFDEFLAELTPKKRKNIRQERRKVQQSGVTFRCLDGYQATAADWADFNGFYQQNTRA